MVINCCAFGCKNRHITGSPITFHSFPTDPKRRKLWIAKVRVDYSSFIPSKGSKICSDHFTDSCFDREKFGGTWLKKDAVPTSAVPPTLVFNGLEESTECDNEDEKLWYLGDFSMNDMFFPYKARKMFNIAIAYQQLANATMLALMGTNKRLRKRIATLQRILTKAKSRANKASEEKTMEIIKKLYDFAGFQLNDMQTEEKAKDMYRLANGKHKQTVQRMKLLKQKNKRMEKQLATLKEKINKKKQFLSEEECKVLKERTDNQSPSSSQQVAKRRKVELFRKFMISAGSERTTQLDKIVTPDVPTCSNSERNFFMPLKLTTENTLNSANTSTAYIKKKSINPLSESLEKESLTQPISPQSTIKQEPTDVSMDNLQLESNTILRDILTRRKEKTPIIHPIVIERSSVFKGTPLSSENDSLFQSAVLIKEELISSEEEL